MAPVEYEISRMRLITSGRRLHFHLGEPTQAPWGISEVRRSTRLSASAIMADVAPLLFDDLAIRFTIKQGADLVSIEIPEEGTDGFPLLVEADAEGVVVWTGTPFHAQYEDRSPKEAVTMALGFVRDALTPIARLCVRSRGDVVHRVDFEMLRGNRWCRCATVVAPTLRFWGSRRQSYLVNRRIKVRDLAGGPA